MQRQRHRIETCVYNEILIELNWWFTFKFNEKNLLVFIEDHMKGGTEWPSASFFMNYIYRLFD
jgi:hypothetical protein